MRAAAQFLALAQARGHALTKATPLDWLTNRGHLDLEGRVPASVFESLAAIFDLLDGDQRALASKRPRRVASDFMLGPVLVEFDESQHFTIHRLATFALYPADARLGFDRAAYGKLCLGWAGKALRSYAHAVAAEFPGTFSRARQRAYLDAVRDLAAPHCGNGPLIRIPAPDRDAEAAVATSSRLLIA